MSVKVINGKIVEIKEITKIYTKADIDEEIERILEEQDMHQTEIDRAGKELIKWEEKKALLNKKEVIK